MRWFYIAVAVAAALLSGCASYTEKTSPCACDWTPVSAAGPVAV